MMNFLIQVNEGQPPKYFVRYNVYSMNFNCQHKLHQNLSQKNVVHTSEVATFHNIHITTSPSCCFSFLVLVIDIA